MEIFLIGGAVQVWYILHPEATQENPMTTVVADMAHLARLLDWGREINKTYNDAVEQALAEIYKKGRGFVREGLRLKLRPRADIGAKSREIAAAYCRDPEAVESRIRDLLSGRYRWKV
jgi:hypothetical protein